MGGYEEMMGMGPSITPRIQLGSPDWLQGRRHWVESRYTDDIFWYTYRSASPDPSSSLDSDKRLCTPLGPCTCSNVVHCFIHAIPLQAIPDVCVVWLSGEQLQRGRGQRFGAAALEGSSEGVATDGLVGCSLFGTVAVRDFLAPKNSQTAREVDTIAAMSAPTPVQRLILSRENKRDIGTNNI
ncbi:hypothetical protein N7454_003450 [Penicillium verhagenii]|nr:hypothetical protein N7454_003450 [Penicillium verhagenii]